MNQKMIRGAAKAREWLKNNGYPYSDETPLVPSNEELEDGGHYALLIPVITSLDILQNVIRLLKSAGVKRAIFGETHGSFLLRDAEIKEMLACCAEEGFGMIFSPGPRPEYDRKSAFFRSQFGMEQGRRLNNNDAIACTIEDVLKLVDFGCRGIVIYDLGILKILNDMRSKQVLPSDLIFIASTHCGIGNAVTAKVFADLGVDQLVALQDIGLPALQDMRRILPNTIPIGVSIDAYETKGGFIRYYEIPEIVQIASPVLLKLGASAQPHPYNPISESILEKRVERILLGVDHLKRANLPIKEISPHSKHWCIPHKEADTTFKIQDSVKTADRPLRHERND